MTTNGNLNNHVDLYGLVLEKQMAVQNNKQEHWVLLQKQTQQKQSAWAVQ